MSDENGRGDWETGGPGEPDAETRGRGDAGTEQESAAPTDASVGDTLTASFSAEVAPVQEEEPVSAAATVEASPGELASVPPVEPESDEQKREPLPEASAADRRKAPRGPRPSLSEEREPVFHEAEGYRLRMDPPDLARLRELPGAKGKTDRELGEQFFIGQSPRLVASISGDVETPAEVRVVVDPYSRQAFLAVGRTIRGIVSF